MLNLLTQKKLKNAHSHRFHNHSRLQPPGAGGRGGKSEDAKKRGREDEKKQELRSK